MPPGVQVPPRLNYLLMLGGLGTVEAPSRVTGSLPAQPALGWGGDSRPSAANASAHYHIQIERACRFMSELPMPDKPDEREILAQEYLARAAYCEFSAKMTGDAQYKQWVERLAREWKEEAATTRKSS